MQRLSLRIPANEPFFNPKDHDAEWSQFAAAVAKVPQNFDVPMIIDGKKVFSKQKRPNVNPSQGIPLGNIQQADESHAKQALEAALKAKEAWANLSPQTRIQKFRDLEVILDLWKYDMMATASVECGYTSAELYVEWAELMDFVRFNNHFYGELMNEQMGDGWGETNQISLRPLKGFTLAVSPFNFPVAIGYHLPLAMALTGNTVVWKPSEEATLTGYLLMLALEEAGFPPGVINMISGDGKPCLPTLLTHPELSALNFTGSFSTAKAFSHYLFSESHPRPNFPRFVAETGGKDFLVADQNIDLYDTAKNIVQGAYGRSGQKCSANSVVFVDERIWPKLKPLVVAEIAKLQVCDPAHNRNSDLGPVISERQYHKILRYIENAQKDKQCQILAGGEASSTKGFYIQPTFIEVATDNHELLREEVFGPVTAIRTYKDLAHVESLIKQHHYRLTGSVISRDEVFLEKAIKILSHYAGNLYVNRRTTGAIVNMQPFGGDESSGTNHKAGGKWYLLNFVSQGTITRRHTRFGTPSAFECLEENK